MNVRIIKRVGLIVVTIIIALCATHAYAYFRAIPIGVAEVGEHSEATNKKIAAEPLLSKLIGPNSTIIVPYNDALTKPVSRGDMASIRRKIMLSSLLLGFPDSIQINADKTVEVVKWKQNRRIITRLAKVDGKWEIQKTEDYLVRF